MTLALLCSGQGQQGPGMLDLCADVAAAQPVFAAAQRWLGRDPRALVADADATALHGNRVGQLLCVTGALAAAQGLALPRFVAAGYSVGELAAWGVCGAWPVATTLALTARRAALMDAADAHGGLGYVRGLTRAQVAALAQAFACALAIVNPGDLLIVGGPRTQVAALCREALARGARGAHPIAVHVASHTPRLAGVVPAFAAELAQSGAAPPSPGRELLSTATGQLVRTSSDGLAGLAAQVARTIDWAATLEALVERDVRHVLEVGAGNALATMVRAAHPQVDARALGDFRSLAGARGWAMQALADR